MTEILDNMWEYQPQNWDKEKQEKYDTIINYFKYNIEDPNFEKLLLEGKIKALNKQLKKITKQLNNYSNGKPTN